MHEDKKNWRRLTYLPLNFRLKLFPKPTYPPYFSSLSFFHSYLLSPILYVSETETFIIWSHLLLTNHAITTAADFLDLFFFFCFKFFLAVFPRLSSYRPSVLLYFLLVFFAELLDFLSLLPWTCCSYLLPISSCFQLENFCSFAG